MQTICIAFIDGSNREPLTLEVDPEDIISEILLQQGLMQEIEGGKKIRERDGAVISSNVLRTSPADSMPDYLELGGPDLKDGKYAGPEPKYTWTHCPDQNCPMKLRKELHTYAQLEACRRRVL